MVSPKVWGRVEGPVEVEQRNAYAGGLKRGVGGWAAHVQGLHTTLQGPSGEEWETLSSLQVLEDAQAGAVRVVRVSGCQALVMYIAACQ